MSEIDPHGQGNDRDRRAVHNDAEPPKPRKLKTDSAFLVLGLISPFVLLGVAVLLVASSQAQIGVIAIPVFFLACLGMLVAGSTGNHIRLFSFGKGGLLGFGTIALLVLLAFGTCLVSLRS